MSGLARDGGLFLPEEMPNVSDRLAQWSKLTYCELALEIFKLYATDIDEDSLRGIVEKSYAVFRTPEVTPTVKVGDVYFLELFHGPTLAFKDVALQFLGNLFEHLLSRDNGTLNIVAATSGDTGSAAIHGVRGRKGINIFVLHPDGRVSPVQALQMTSVLDANVHNLAVAGTFDDCQAMVKSVFADLPFRDAHHIGAVNSINWARVMAQVVYYFYSAFRVMEKTGSGKVSFTVPTGNFGDVFAGYVAYKMGLPVDKLVIATDENDILARTFATGVYKTGGVVPTISPSMDIQIASNFERYIYFLKNGDGEAVAALMRQFAATGEIALTDGGAPLADPVFAAGSATQEQTLAAIRETWERHNYLIDPHTAVGASVARGFLGDAPMICLSTAHPAKFGGAIEKAVGRDIATHPIVEALKGAKTHVDKIDADFRQVEDFIVRTL